MKMQCLGFCWGVVLLVFVCVCLWRRFTRNNTGQNLPMINNKRCLRSMSECPHISAARAETVQSAGKGQPICERERVLSLYLHLNPGAVFGQLQ